MKTIAQPLFNGAPRPSSIVNRRSTDHVFANAATAKSRVLANAPTAKTGVLANAATAKSRVLANAPTASAASPHLASRLRSPVSTSPSLPISASPTLPVSLSSFNPALPEDGALILADVLRNQFNGLVVMIQNIPAGPAGPQGVPGIQGPPFAQAIIDGVTTLEPAEPAWVSSYFDGTDVHFSFGIPCGYEGVQGTPGTDGGEGPVGPQGPPFAQAIIDGVTTVDPGQPAWVTCYFDGTNVRFEFGIPRGADGQQGEPGPPGEVTTAQLDDAISGTSNNTNAVATLDTPFADPDMEEMRQKLNELLLAARR